MLKKLVYAVGASCLFVTNVLAATQTDFQQQWEEAQQGLFAGYDRKCDQMSATPAPMKLHESVPPAHLSEPVPKKVHTIWFGDRQHMPAAKVDKWRIFSEKFGYEHRLWTEDDDAVFRALMPAASYTFFQQFLRMKNYRACSDLVRISLLLEYGGIYADADIAPPQSEGELIDLTAFMPMTNIAFMTEKMARNVGTSALFVANGFTVAAAHHPLMAHMSDTVANNIQSYHPSPFVDDEVLPPWEESYMTGPFFVNRSLSGVFQVIPIQLLYQLKMID